MTYAKKLLDPRWQKKRLQILERDMWSCRLCGDSISTLHVHHKKYKGDPWDVNNDDLITYCKYCHSIIEFYKGRNIDPVKILRSYNGSICQFHITYWDYDNAELQIDTFWSSGDNVEYRSTISHCALFWVKDILFNNAEAPF